MDLIVMTSLGTRERTVTEWHAIFHRVGMSILHIDTYNSRLLDSVFQTGSDLYNSV